MSIYGWLLRIYAVRSQVSGQALVDLLQHAKENGYAAGWRLKAEGMGKDVGILMGSNGMVF